MIPTSISSFEISNNRGTHLSLVLEPEGDCIELRDGQKCRIVPAMTNAEPVDCELAIESDGSLTLYLSIAKEIFVDSVKVR